MFIKIIQYLNVIKYMYIYYFSIIIILEIFKLMLNVNMINKHFTKKYILIDFIVYSNIIKNSYILTQNFNYVYCI